MNNLFTTKKINFFCALIILTYIVTMYTYDGTIDLIQVGSLGLFDKILIFILNFLIFNFLLLTSFIGLPIFFSISFVSSMVSGSLLSGIPNNVYFYSSISHGVLELILYYYLVSFTIELFKSYWQDYKQYNTFLVKDTTKDFLKNEYLKCTVIIMVASFFEVFVSNNILIYLI